ncbi:hypothetical protein EVG20_g9785 [Dentipellis fragilis]|uniref:Thiaminase-2/PQQC domain-containing protein n=1 Tax=Dentipellis fragilis TaxID=205917 RepID=A0A4Y9XYM4_9AGAM|nr:hypothetical protein EVG20_g9785 [Dentipellis fragilis]
MSAAETLTKHLYSLSTPRPYSAATEHAFLRSAGDGTLPPTRFALWLAQDRLYAAHAYPRFIGRLISAIPYSGTHVPGSPDEAQNQQILRVLVYCLQNVVREVGFFDDASKELGLDVHGWRERKETRDYTAEMARISTEGSLFDGLVFLWAMEQVYLDAWKFVNSTLRETKAPETYFARSFAANWTNAEFVTFVNDLADLVNRFGVQKGSESWVRAEQIWARVVELEEAFWPTGGEELTMKAASAV